jgi:hypothetical protein
LYWVGFSVWSCWSSSNGKCALAEVTEDVNVQGTAVSPVYC